MKLIENVKEVTEAVSVAKGRADAYCTNFFPTERKLHEWIEHRNVLCESWGNAALFFRKDRDFWHLYFCAASSAALKRAVAEVPMIRTEPVVVDLVGKETGLGDLARLFEVVGFRRYQHLFRMARIVEPAPPRTWIPDPRVNIAGQADCAPILDLLLRSFDRRAEQIPMPYEMAAAVDAGQVLVAHYGGRLAGLLFYKTQGLTSTLRYWLIAPECRSQGFGSALMKRYFADHPAVKRFLLWVVSGNTPAIDKYEHYGFAPDGLVDHVLANERVRP